MIIPPFDAFQRGVLPDHPVVAGYDYCVYLNSRYQVNIRDCGEIAPFGQVYQLSIKRRDKSPIMDWGDMQRIKTELIGAEAEMVQLFPAESRHVDTSNQYYFFAFPSYRFPFGFIDRFLSEDMTMGNVQRPFAPEHRERHPDIGARDDEARELKRSIDKYLEGKK